MFLDKGQFKMELVRIITPSKELLGFMDKSNNPCMFIIDIHISDKNKLRTIKIPHEPDYIVNRPLGEIYKLIDIMKAK